MTESFSSDRPTLKTIAGLTELSVASVSRALQNAGDIGAETKAKVREVALRVGDYIWETKSADGVLINKILPDGIIAGSATAAMTVVVAGGAAGLMLTQGF